MSGGEAVFAALAAIAIVSALNVILRRNPVHSAIFLSLVIVSLAGMFVLLNAEFIAAVEVIIYAGAIIVLFLFTMMLLDVRGGMQVRQLQRQAPVAVPMVILLGLALVGVAIGTANVSGAAPTRISAVEAAEMGSVQNLGQELYSNFLLPFELASIVLTIGLVGAIGLAGQGDQDEEELERIADAVEFDQDVREEEGGVLDPEVVPAGAGHA